MSRFLIALSIFGFLALIAWWTLPDMKVRGVTMVLLAMFAFKTWLHHRRQALENRPGGKNETEQ